MNASPLPRVISEPDVKAGELLPARDSVTVAEKERMFDRVARLIHRFEWIAIAMLAIIAVSLHIRFVSHVGGLWRDEANSVAIATLPSLGQIWRSLDYDSFPIVYFALLRSWTSIFGPANDYALRALGLIIGLGVLVVLWMNARAFGARRPVLSLALVGLNPMLIRYGDSTRAYGLGILLILLTFASFWRLVNSVGVPSYPKILKSTALALLSVQCLYYNSVLLLAIAAGAMAVALRERAWRTAGIILAIGILSATSLLPYLPMMRRMREWTFLVSYPVDLAWLWKRGSEVIGSPDPLATWIWTGLLLGGLTVAGGFWAYSSWRNFAERRLVNRAVEPAGSRKSAPLRQPPIPAAILFGTVTLIVAVPAYVGFLRLLNYYTQPWYYITLAAFVACALDIVFGAWPEIGKNVLSLSLRGTRLLAVFMLVCLAALPAWAITTIHHTNVDVLAAQVRLGATKEDVVVVSNWEYGVSFCRYYHGPAEVITLPPISDHRFHRYDLALRQMMIAEPLKPVFARIAQVLRSGHRIFLIGSFPSPRLDVLPPASPAGYLDAGGGWHGAPYDVIWVFQTGHFLHSHALRYSEIKVPLPGKPYVQDFENLHLNIAEGWR
ncbi:MAG: hypothetical protein QOH39_544 [Verrucomicrobiota bacterium]